MLDSMMSWLSPPPLAWVLLQLAHQDDGSDKSHCAAISDQLCEVMTVIAWWGQQESCSEKSERVTTRSGSSLDRMIRV